MRGKGRRWSTSAAQRVAAGMVGAVVLTVVIGLGTPRPAAALTPDEYFVIRVYDDFLRLDPTAAQLAWWTAYMGSNSHAQTVAAILDLPAFEVVWVGGVNYLYLEQFDSTSPEVASQMADIASTGSFLRTELAVLEGAGYYALNGATNATFVSALYEDVVGRSGSPGEVSYWAGEIDSATRSRRQVAAAIIGSAEVVGLRVRGPVSASTCAFTGLVDVTAPRSGAYCIVLDRMASSTEASYWITALQAADQLPDLWAAMAGSSEYYNGAQP